jgi:hypothetical protein
MPLSLAYFSIQLSLTYFSLDAALTYLPLAVPTRSIHLSLKQTPRKRLRKRPRENERARERDQGACAALTGMEFFFWENRVEVRALARARYLQAPQGGLAKFSSESYGEGLLLGK